MSIRRKTVARNCILTSTEDKLVFTSQKNDSIWRKVGSTRRGKVFTSCNFLTYASTQWFLSDRKLFTISRTKVFSIMQRIVSRRQKIVSTIQNLIWYWIYSRKLFPLNWNSFLSYWTNNVVLCNWNCLLMLLSVPL